MIRLFCLFLGYVCGSFLTAVPVARLVSGNSIFEQGTGNPGTANMTRLFGLPCGACVLAGDLAKTFLVCLVCRCLLFPDLGATAAAYAGLGAVLGHNFPFWHRFRGGKGVACTCAAIACISFPLGVFSCAAGGITVGISRNLPVSAVLIPSVFLILAFFFLGAEITILSVALTALMFLCHFIKK